jgi:hypothetical protein
MASRDERGRFSSDGAWYDRALGLLRDGASYTEVARTVGVDRKQVSKKFPGYGWTKQQGIEFREMKKKMEDATL